MIATLNQSQDVPSRTLPLQPVRPEPVLLKASSYVQHCYALCVAICNGVATTNIRLDGQSLIKEILVLYCIS